MGSYENILEAIRRVPVVNTHNHHLPDALHAGAGLRYILDNSYTGWTGKAPDMADARAIRRYIEENLCNTYYRWLFGALEELYGLAVTVENFAEIDRRVRRAHENPARHLELLKGVCRFERIVNERQPDPGSDLGHPELFAPSFRCDSYFSGYAADKPDPNGFFARATFENPEIGTIEDYLAEMKRAIARKKEAGCVALKVAIAYERPLDFDEVDVSAARRALNNPDAGAREVTAFGNLVMRGICEAAAECRLPLQIHTGMGQLNGTNPMRALSLICAHPDAKFHLLHGGFPWLDDTLALLHNMKNVWSDTVWIPYLSTHKAVDYIISALEVGGATRLTWGCDAWVSEDSLGALRAMEHVLARALSHMVDDGAFGIAYAQYLAGRTLRENARDLFGL